MSNKNKILEQTVPCCPPLASALSCDVLEYHYRLLYPVIVGAAAARQSVPVEVTLVARLERCSGPLALGDLIYSTTLLPGEKVRLFTADRRTQFTYDSESKIIYRAEQSQEEQYYMSSMDEFMSDLTVKDNVQSTNTTKGRSDSHGSTSGVLATIFGSPSVNVKGSFDSESISEFVRELKQHAQASHHRSVEATRTASSVSIGEVQTTIHQEGETQDHFESASREFSNPNRCHAITFYFYKINKTQTIKFSIVSIEKRIVDPAADTRVTNNAFTSKGDISILPAALLATNPKRLELESMGRQSVSAATNMQATATTGLSGMSTYSAHSVNPQPISLGVRKQAITAVNAQLAQAGLIDGQTGELSNKTKEFSFEIHSSLPTPGFLVKGCLDSCDVCEEARKREIELELEKKKLENELLKRQIELLDKAQEYRCCPQNSVEDAATNP